jgi:hypothetical protein
LQIEQFLDEKVDLPSIEDVGHVEDFFTNDCMFLTKHDFEGAGSIYIEFELFLCYFITLWVLLLHWTVFKLMLEYMLALQNSYFLHYILIQPR